MSSAVDQTKVLRRAARRLGRALGADFAGAYVLDADGEALRAVAGYRVPRDLLEAFVEFPIPVKGHRLIVEAWETRGPVFSDHAEVDYRLDRLLAERFPVRSVLFVPLLEAAELTGALVAAWLTEARAFTPAEITLATLIGHQTGAAMKAPPGAAGTRRIMGMDLKATLKRIAAAWPAGREHRGTPRPAAPVGGPPDEPRPSGDVMALIPPLLAETPPADWAGSSSADPDVAGPTILVVDDEDETRALMREALEEAGYNVLEAREGNDALLVADWHAGPIDLIVTDVMMPHVDGGELGQRVRPLRADTKVLYVSGYPKDRLPDTTVHFLPKPFTPDVLTAKVRALLHGPGPASPSA